MRKFKEVNPNSFYQGPLGEEMARKFMPSHSGQLTYGNWVLRNEHGEYVDRDQFRNALAERHNIELIHD